MITIIDRTMGHVNYFHARREALSTFITSLFKSGVTHFEGTPALFFRAFPELAPQYSSLTDTSSCLLYLDRNQLSLTENPYQRFDIETENRPKTHRPCSLTGISDLLDTDQLGHFLDLLQESPLALNFCPDNSLHCGTALAMEWFSLGGKALAQALPVSVKWPRWKKF
ncbi:hypothetical protein Q5O14_03995 [Eubacteriaceae bacterium ES2]|nr:hypothetical protein Q5O14_03995 [Eubacteriaceae bacterium ES2]